MIAAHGLERAARQALAKAALAHAKELGWAGVRIDQLAARAGLAPGDFHPATPSDAIEALEEMFDREVALSPLPEVNEARERLFELCMRRFEAMEPHRAALREINRVDALANAVWLKTSVRSARWLLGLAGLADGPMGALRAGPLALVLARARRAWQQDTEGDFARTLVSLDRDLRRAEAAQTQWDRLMARLRGIGPNAAQGQDEAGG